MNAREAKGATGPHVVRWGVYSIAVNVVLVALHGTIAAASDSLAVMAELIHNFVDLTSAGVVVVGLKLATRKAAAFPYGLYKVENLVAAGIAILIFLTAYEVVRDLLVETVKPPRVDTWMLVLLVATTAIPLVFSHFELRVGHATGSPALIADAREYRIHVYTTGLAFAALLSARFDLPLDRIAAIVIVAAIVKTGWDLLVGALRVLLDASLDHETLSEIRRVIAADAAVAEIKWITGRNAGRFRFVEAGVAFRPADLEKAEAAMQRIERDVRTAMPRVERVLLHIEVRQATHRCYAVPLADLSGKISEHFGEAPYFALATIRLADAGVLEQRMLPNPHRTAAKAKGIRVAEWLVGKRVDVVLMKEDVRGKGPDYVLREAGIEVQRTEAQTLAEAMPYGSAD
jgi:cation diffusion facilitator family transporter